jgi:hypothetical protein
LLNTLFKAGHGRSPLSFPAVQEAEIGKVEVQGHPRQKIVLEILMSTEKNGHSGAPVIPATAGSVT